MLEILIAMGIMAILSVIGYIGIENASKSWSIKAAARAVRADLELAKARATKDRLQYRVVFTDTGYDVEVGNAARASTEWNKATSPDISQDLTEYHEVTFDKGASVAPVFSPNGTVGANSQLIVKNDQGKSMTVRVSMTGRIRID